MRLHHLTITAFGPFADRVSVDFDALGQAGLFLLTGPTGAGKSSVLDAVCFALYGDVPGDRSTAKRLRSDQAEPDVAPRVELELTVAGRRFRITRSPSWDRAKRRGTGVARQPASVALSELRGDQWQPLTSRLDEAGHQITQLVGMNLPQFTQVALLPQGRFQAFLRAKSEDRHRLLQQLFRTGRFEQVELWLRERRVTLHRQVESAQARVSDVASRISEASGSALHDDWLVPEVHPWATGQLTAARGTTSERAGTVELAQLAATQAEQTLIAARAHADQRRRLVAARACLTELEGSEAQHAAAQSRLERARRAVGLRPLNQTVGSTAATASAASQAAMTAVTAAGLDSEISSDELPALLDQCRDQVAGLRTGLPLLRRRDELTRRSADLSSESESLTHQVKAALAEHAALPGQFARLRQRAEQAKDQQALLEEATTELAQVDTWLAAAAHAQGLMEQLGRSTATWLAAQTAALECRESYLAVRESRIDSMAAELALALAVGASCPVCGSADHPHKATSAPDAPDAKAEKQALRAVDDANAAALLLHDEVRGLQRALETAQAACGEAGTDDLQDQRRQLQARVDELAEAIAGHPDFEVALAMLEQARETTDDEVHQLRLRQATVDTELSALANEITALTADLDDPDLTVEAGQTELERVECRRDALTQAASALATSATATLIAERARQHLETSALDCGFDSAAQALDALLTAAELDELEARLREVHQQRAAAIATIRELEEVDTLDVVPDVQTAQRAHDQATATATTAHAQHLAAADRVSRLTALISSLELAVAAWQPVHAQWQLTASLAAFVEGKAPDNTLQMRLSAYVLAYRFAQVVDAANARLVRMSDQRYSLEHTAERGAGETRGGLSLLVRDVWSGESRDPATLSGGETFIVSLALALGLADVIAHEAGGADLETLFVDEGFGSLDAATLDDVMDTLDSLREGGRVVGVVSHVAEMRDRIPTQLLVAKSRRGSTIRVQTAS